MRRHERGYSLIEIVVALAVFSLFLYIVTTLTLDLKKSEKKWPINYMKHPQVMAVLARLRNDVLDASPPYYPSEIATFEQTSTTLLLTTIDGGTSRNVVWDFSKPGEAYRRVFLGEREVSTWIARGLPTKFKIVLFDDLAGHPDGMRIQARDKKNVLAIDQILQPRSTLMVDPEEEEEEEETPAPTPPAFPPLPTPAVPTPATPTPTATEGLPPDATTT